MRRSEFSGKSTYFLKIFVQISLCIHFLGSYYPKSQVAAPRPQESVLESESDYYKMSVQVNRAFYYLTTSRDYFINKTLTCLLNILQEERRLEFQQRRLRLQQRKKQTSQKSANQETLLPQFAIGKAKTPDPAPTKSHGISAFFPSVSGKIILLKFHR